METPRSEDSDRESRYRFWYAFLVLLSGLLFLGAGILLHFHGGLSGGDWEVQLWVLRADGLPVSATLAGFGALLIIVPWLSRYRGR